MALLPILSAPHPVLSAKARKVRPDEFGAELLRLLDDMAETMYAAPGVGLAAPQIGDSRRILVADPGFEGEEGARRKGVDLVYMVNPEIIEASATKIKWEESCLSVPDLSQKRRAQRQDRHPLSGRRRGRARAQLRGLPRGGDAARARPPAGRDPARAQQPAQAHPLPAKAEEEGRRPLSPARPRSA
jgi:peptide deformylase